MSGTKLPKAVAYVRVSTADQAREGWSLAVQRQRVRAYCEARGWRLSRVYADEGISSAARRPAFEEMVDDVLADGVNAIVAMKLDRLGRSAAGLLSLYERLERKGVRIVTIEDGIDTSTANGRLMRQSSRRSPSGKGTSSATVRGPVYEPQWRTAGALGSHPTATPCGMVGWSSIPTNRRSSGGSALATRPALHSSPSRRS